MSYKKADDNFSGMFLILLAVGGVMFINAWIHNELPTWAMRLIAHVSNASPTGGR